MGPLRRLLNVDPPESAELRGLRGGPSRKHDEYAVTLSGSAEGITLYVAGDDERDVVETVKQYLDVTDDPEIGDGDWRTVDANFQGQDVVFTYRASWVSGFAVAKRRRGDDAGFTITSGRM